MVNLPYLTRKKNESFVPSIRVEKITETPQGAHKEGEELWSRATGRHLAFFVKRKRKFCVLE